MKRILCCLDSSPRAAHVLSAAVDLAKGTGAKVMLFRSVGLPPDMHPLMTVGTTPAHLVDLLLENAGKELDTMARQVPPELLEGAFTHVGTAWDAICQAAKDKEADVIVLGSHGYGALDRLLGTTAAKVVNHADRSVYVVK
jgi:universal stress protein F